MLSGGKVRWQGRNTERDAAHHLSKKIHVATSQLEVQLDRSVGDNKKSL